MPQGFNLGLVGAGGAAGAAGALEEILAARKAEELQRAKQAMDEQQLALQSRQVGVQEGGLGLNRDKFAADEARQTQLQQRLEQALTNMRAREGAQSEMADVLAAGGSASMGYGDTAEGREYETRMRQAAAEAQGTQARETEGMRQDFTARENSLDRRSREGIAAAGRDAKERTLPSLSQVNSLNSAYMRNTKGAQTVIEASRNLDKAMDALQGGNVNAASQAILIGFQKILDPTSVVRESEYARGQEGQALLSRIQGAQQRLIDGGQGVTPGELQQFVGLAQMFAQGYRQQAEAEKARVGKIADSYGIPRELVFVEDAATPSPTGDPTTAAPAQPSSGGGAPRRRVYDPATGSFR